jgi:Methyltransferase domain
MADVRVSSMEDNKRARVRAELLASMPKGCVVAEIGVWEGMFSERILEICEPSELHLIDPWMYMPQFGNTGFGRKKNEFLMEQKYQEVMEKFADDPRVIIHRTTSDVALAKLPDGCLDWVYIDGNHNEPYVGNDLALCLQKVKPDGFISGDDYHWMSDAQGAPVKRAVESLMQTMGEQASLRLRANQYVISLNRSGQMPATRAHVA